MAEKLEAMITLGDANSRLKDFFDLYLLAGLFDFEGSTLAEAIAATLARRGTSIPTAELPALAPEFTDATERETQWRAFVRRTQPHSAPGSLADTVPLLRRFLLPPLAALAAAHPFPRMWRPGGPWQEAVPRTPPL